MEKEKITIENRITQPFTWVENELIRSRKLTYEALGLYVTLRSYGPGTAYPSITYLCKLGGSGRDKIYRILNNLEAAKLIIRRRRRGNNGLYLRHGIEYRILSPHDNYNQTFTDFTGRQLPTDITSHPRPEKPYVDKPHVDKPHVENRTLSISSINNQEPKIKKESSSSGSGGGDDDALFLKFKEFSKERVKAALTKMREREKGGQEIKNKTGYLLRMLKNGFDDVIPSVSGQERRQPPEYKHPYAPPDNECTPLRDILKNFWNLEK